jgi:uncharacterized membrane protein
VYREPALLLSGIAWLLPDGRRPRAGKASARSKLGLIASKAPRSRGGVRQIKANQVQKFIASLVGLATVLFLSAAHAQENAEPAPMSGAFTLIALVVMGVLIVGPVVYWLLKADRGSKQDDGPELKD